MPEFYFDNINNFLLIVIAAGVAAPILAFAGRRLADAAKLRLVPVEVADARVVAKRLEVKTKDSNKKVYTVYFLTFSFINGTRREFETGAEKYSVCAEGDWGKLSFHGSKFLSFNIA